MTLQKVGVTSWKDRNLTIMNRKKNALRVSVAGRVNISPIILAHTVTIWICTRLQRVITAENSTACEYYESTRHAGSNNVILLSENVIRMMGLWIRNTPTAFRSPLLSISDLETFLASQEISGPTVIRQLLGQTYTRSFPFCSPPILMGPIDQQITSFGRVAYDVCLKWFGALMYKKYKTEGKRPNRRQIQKGKLISEQRMLKRRLKEAPIHERSELQNILNDIKKKKILMISRA